MKHTIRIDNGQSVCIENRALGVVRLELVSAHKTEVIDLSPERASAIAAALCISAEFAERAADRANLQALVTNCERGGVVRRQGVAS